MVNSAVANVGRWSALAFGLFYGYTHNISLQKQAEQKKIEAEYHRKELLIEQARLEYAKKQVSAPQAAETEVKFDIESPDFDLEKYLDKFEKESN
ncbi:MAG: ATP synthase E chain-domain-containing protein [Benjaminiella poitrasii]|nr:MAG: ATP synthase E chain-domain-containing protein [Benjaminiella poitrasii]